MTNISEIRFDFKGKTHLFKIDLFKLGSFFDWKFVRKEGNEISLSFPLELGAHDWNQRDFRVE